MHGDTKGIRSQGQEPQGTAPDLPTAWGLGMAPGPRPGVPTAGPSRQDKGPRTPHPRTPQPRSGTGDPEHLVLSSLSRVCSPGLSLERAWGPCRDASGGGGGPGLELRQKGRPYTHPLHAPHSPPPGPVPTEGQASKTGAVSRVSLWTDGPGASPQQDKCPTVHSVHTAWGPRVGWRPQSHQPGSGTVAPRSSASQTPGDSAKATHTGYPGMWPRCPHRWHPGKMVSPHPVSWKMVLTQVRESGSLPCPQRHSPQHR